MISDPFGAGATHWALPDQFEITFIDSGRKAQCPPDPEFPDGIAVDLSGGKTPACCVALPYPAKGIGGWSVTCKRCSVRVALTTAGRPDDPRSVLLPCQL
jgi:hypothetical protein